MEQQTLTPTYRLTSHPCPRCGATLRIEDIEDIEDACGPRLTTRCLICDHRQDLPVPCEGYDPDLLRHR